jgi:hypothetical protein
MTEKSDPVTNQNLKGTILGNQAQFEDIDLIINSTLITQAEN